MIDDKTFTKAWEEARHKAGFDDFDGDWVCTYNKIVRHMEDDILEHCVSPNYRDDYFSSWVAAAENELVERALFRESNDGNN